MVCLTVGRISRRAGIVWAVVAAAAYSAAAPPVEYRIRFPNRVHHEAEVEVVWRAVEGPDLEVCMSRTSPGRYALHEFAKNVYDVAAWDGPGRQLRVERTKPHCWNVSGHDGTVRFRYTLFGDRGDGTYNQIDDSHAHLNGPATYVWARGTEDRPVRVRFEIPEGSGWQAATQLKPTGDAFTFEAPNREYLMDSPVELSRFDLREWKVDDGRRVQTLRLAVHHTGSAADVDAFAGMVEKVVREEIGIFGELPVFDYGTYTFLADYLPWATGDGMEHRNSTYCTSTRSLTEEARRLVGTIAHEFFHAWNVERLRPASLEPFDLERLKLAGELWFAEGFTSYYTMLTLRRAGLLDRGQFAARLSRLLDSVLNSPARRHESPVLSSLLAPLTDGAVAKDPTNFRNTHLSYYNYGSAVALGLDLELRRRFPGRSLDDYMRVMWDEFGREEKPYGLADLEAVLGRVAGDAAFAREFFRASVYGRELPDYEQLLAEAGFLLRRAEPEQAFLGASHLSFRSDGVVLGAAPLEGTPLYEAGLDRGAKIMRIDGKRVRNRKHWNRLLAKRRPGDVIEVRYEQRGRQETVRVRVAASPRLEVVPFEDAGRRVTDDAARLRRDWLGSRAAGEVAREGRP